MMVGKDQELGLSLSLSFHEKTRSTAAPNPTDSLHVNLMPSFPYSSPSPFAPINKNWTDLFPSSDRSSELCRDETRSFPKGIDVNRCAAEEEDAGVSSPNSTISNVSGKQSERENTDGIDELDIDRACSRGISDEEDAENARKKLRLSKDQSAVLEESFKEHNTLNPKQKQALAKRLGVSPRQVEVWFQNRRARTKLKQTEVDCELLKRCWEKLTEEKRRLQKEVHELRALKLLSPQFYMQMNPPTTLTMCPSCEGVAAPSSANQMAASAHQRQSTFNPWAAVAPVPRKPFV